MKTVMTKHHQQTYDAIFQHPIARDLHRHYVVAMLAEIGELTEEPNGNIKVSRNGHTLALHISREKNIVTIDELMVIRHFLEGSTTPADEAPATAGHFLVVIDHRQARIYKTELQGAVPQTITPFDPHGFGRTLHYVQDESKGQRKPELKSFYDAIATTLKPATQILLFGNGTGAASAMEQLLLALQKHHPDIARHVVGSHTLDTQHLTEAQLLAKAREFYETKTVTSSAT